VIFCGQDAKGFYTNYRDLHEWELAHQLMEMPGFKRFDETAEWG
jgi:hypothetical protein